MFKTIKLISIPRGGDLVLGWRIKDPQLLGDRSKNVRLSIVILD